MELITNYYGIKQLIDLLLPIPKINFNLHPSDDNYN